MCIAILNRKKSILDDTILINSFNNNNNGAGFAYINSKNELTIIKGIFNLDVFLQTYKDIKKDALSDVIIHCRISTSGSIDFDNCHPHQINKNLILVHNGILNMIDVSKNSIKSDTVLFIEKYLKNLTIEQLQDNHYIQLLSDFITASNKFIIMDKNGKTYIINEQAGTTDKYNNWFSNNSYQYNYSSFYSYPVYKLNKKLKKKIKHNIDNMSSKELIKVGYHPLFNVHTGTIYNESIYEYSNSINYYDDLLYLEDVDEELYNYYLQQYEPDYYNNYDSYYNYQY